MEIRYVTFEMIEGLIVGLSPVLEEGAVPYFSEDAAVEDAGNDYIRVTKSGDHWVVDESNETDVSFVRKYNNMTRRNELKQKFGSGWLHVKDLRSWRVTDGPEGAIVKVLLIGETLPVKDEPEDKTGWLYFKSADHGLVESWMDIEDLNEYIVTHRK